MENYIEPFFGSGAVLLKRPAGHRRKLETVNDLDGMVCNFWRAVRAEPEQVAEHADWPTSELDLHARHRWLVNSKPELQARLETDPDYYDVKAAGWWVWGISNWIGSGWCGVTTNRRPHISPLAGIMTAGKLPHKLPDLSRPRGIMSVQIPNISHPRGIMTSPTLAAKVDWLKRLSNRLWRVRVCCGDWIRVCGSHTVTTYQHGITGVFLDPPYSADAGRNMDLYAHDDGDVAHAVREYALERGDNPRFRIALCGYEGEHDMPDTWTVYKWKTCGGYGNQGGDNENRGRERIWFSPHCLKPRTLFGK